jgi:hypothetical protein
MVRWNAALALVRFGDAAGEPQLKFMLRPYDLRAPLAGTITLNVNAKDAIRSGGVVAHIKTQTPDPAEIRSPLAGLVDLMVAKDGAAIAAGDEIAIISPDDQQVWEALQALYFVGRPEDLPDVDRYVRPTEGMSARVPKQAALTAEAIRKRVLKEARIVGGGKGR